MENLAGFDWNDGNRDKNWNKHKVSNSECEEIFYNLPLLVEADAKHSILEERYYVLGQTNQGRFLFIVFMERNQRIRVISAKDMNRKERSVYEKANTEI
ncbi:MAG: BrnT family toxin [Deltaproteobacteria bacterium]|jgi:uncharacterized protein|nr:BrnT family toxin [Deltaproteobacteria bacterium]MBT4087027.1 BrnT family toxin [Deltaproteobacteria bacterium]MBT4263448.1 BrnT family toxin [Deltaproteobacteria bacterium]MBT4637897.1 BrnT family toxin [Deltaproteobacteria bacterium]MBT6498446.1 BrnT family toxin [Deltaproteobacteria bacterium]